MKRKHVLAGVLAVAMTMLSACSGMPGMGNAQPAAGEGTRERGRIRYMS